MFDGVEVPNICDANDANGIVATNDGVGFVWSGKFGAAGEEFTLTQTLPEGWKWSDAVVGQTTSDGANGLYTSVGILSNDDRTLTVTLSPIQADLSIELKTLVAIPGIFADTTTAYTPQLSFESDAGSEQVDTTDLTACSTPITRLSKGNQGQLTSVSKDGVPGRQQGYRLTYSIPAGAIGQKGGTTIDAPGTLIDTWDGPTSSIFALQGGWAGNSGVTASWTAGVNQADFALSSTMQVGDSKEVRYNVWWPNSDLPAATEPGLVVKNSALADWNANPDPYFQPNPVEYTRTINKAASISAGSLGKSLFWSTEGLNPTIPTDPGMVGSTGWSTLSATATQSVPSGSLVLARILHSTSLNSDQVYPALQHREIVDTWNLAEQQLYSEDIWVSANTATAWPSSAYTVEYRSGGTWHSSFAAAGGSTQIDGIRVTANGGTPEGQRLFNVSIPFKVVAPNGTTPVTDTATATLKEAEDATPLSVSKSASYSVNSVLLEATKTASKNSIMGGETIDFTLGVEVKVPLGSNEAMVDHLVVTDTLPLNVVAYEIVDLPSFWTKLADDTTPNGNTVLSFRHDGLVSSEDTVPEITVRVVTSIQAPATGIMVNLMGVTAGVASATTSASVPVYQAAVLQLTKFPSTPVIEIGDNTVSWTSQWFNYQNDSQGLSYVVDVLPYDGDPRGTSFHGDFEITSVQLTAHADAGATLEYTTDAPTLVAATPAHNPAGAVTWQPLADPANLPAGITAVRVVVNDFLAGNRGVGSLQIVGTVSGQETGDKYGNTSFGHLGVSNLPLVETQPAIVNVVSSTISGRVVYDAANTGVYDEAMPGIGGVTVGLFDLNGGPDPVATVQTNPDGEYSFETHSGSYEVRLVTVPNGYEPTFSPAQAPGERVSGTVILGMGTDLDEVNFGEYLSDPITFTKAVESSTAVVEDGTVLTYTITVENIGGAPAVVRIADDLTDVLDDADLVDSPESDTPSVTISSLVDGRFELGGSLAGGATATITYDVIVKAQASRGNHQADNFLVALEDEPGTAGPCEEDSELCTSTPLPELTSSKVADPASGTSVSAGEEITYTLTFENLGTGPGTVDFTDDLTDVIDDAILVDGPTSSDPALTASLNANGTLSIDGVLAGEETVTISYTVEVKADGQRTNNLLANVLAPADIVSPDCEADDVSCTSHPIPQLESWKQVEADSTPVVEGSVLTYTLFFANSGTSAATVDKIDDLTHVLDDADITSEPTSSDGLVIARNGNQISIEGTVPAGMTYTVVYEVTVKESGQTGDNIAANFLLEGDPNNPPVAPEQPTCQPDDADRPDCTVTPIGRLLTGKSVSASTDPVGAGTVLAYTLTFDNQSEASVPVDYVDQLADVLDDAVLTGVPVASDPALTVSPVADDRFTVVGTLAAGATVTVSYEVTVNGETDRGNNVAANFLLPSDQDLPDPGTECEALDANCTSTPLPNVSVAKTSDPEPGSGVQSGDQVTYTLTFTNTGETAGEVDFVDNLSGVLDDATLTGAVDSSDPALGASSGDDGLIRVIGTLDKDQTVTVSYTVTVKPDGDHGDNLLRNVVTKTGEVAPDCSDEAAPCTVHPIGELDDWKSVESGFGATLRPGESAVYTLHFENVGNAPIDVNKDDALAQVLDDADITVAAVASNSSLAVSDVVAERLTVSGTLQPGEYVTVSYTITVKPDGERGDDRLANFLISPADPTPEVCEPEDEERLDCTVNRVSDVKVTKSSELAADRSRTDELVDPGEEVTYTLTFTNQSGDPEAAAAEVDYTDHMVDVLDDAELVAGPDASNEALAAVVDGDTIRVTGEVPTGEVYTVTYVVKVKEYAEQGNHVLKNAVAITGEQPVCVPDSELCTEHNLAEPPAGKIPVTGSAMAVALLVVAMLLLGSGGMFVIAGRRRKADANGSDDLFPNDLTQ